LSRDKWDYALWTKEPPWAKVTGDFDGDELYSFCVDLFERYFPALKLRKNTKCKLKLTQLKNGIKLEKVKAKK
jgi:hypothetical protein